MSFAETSSAATASIVVSPATTWTACIGPHAVGVIVPEKVPLSAALAEPPSTRTMAPQRREDEDCATWVVLHRPPRSWFSSRRISTVISVSSNVNPAGFAEID